MDPSIDAFATTLFRSLRTMDDEASTRINGTHAGLVDYAGHCGVTTKQYEVPIYRRLARLLTATGYPAVTDQPYPYDTGQSCDVVVDVGGTRLWLEVKQAWKEWFSNVSGGVKTSGFYRSYLLGPEAGGLDRTHSAAQDFEKLEQLRATEAAYAGLLLIGFDAEHRPMDSDVEQLTRVNELAARGWVACGPEAWPDRNRPSCRIVCYFWWRDARGATATSRSEPDATVAAPPGQEAGDAAPAAEVAARDADVAAAVRRAEDDPAGLRRDAAKVFRRYLEVERKLKKAAGGWLNAWTWEQAIADILRLPQSASLVSLVAAELRTREQPYQLENYDDAWRFDRLLDHFEDELRDHT